MNPGVIQGVKRQTSTVTKRNWQGWESHLEWQQPALGVFISFPTESCTSSRAAFGNWKLALPTIILVMMGLAEMPVPAASSDDDQPKKTQPGDQPPLSVDSSSLGIWEDEVGSGFRKGTWHAGFSMGGSTGTPVLGGNEGHDLVLATTHVGYILTGVLGEGHWFQGNLDLLGELVVGRQFSPGEGYVVGLTPVLRYDFATGTRWMPFMEAGAGIAGTTIGEPDLAGGFQFHLLVGGGINWFIRGRTALSFQYRFGHVSNGGMKSPNAGLNTHELLLGLTWFF